MHKVDEERLEQMVGSHELPLQLKQLYDQAEVVWHRIASGPLPDHLLVMLVAVSNSVKVEDRDDSIWDRIEKHTPVIVKTDGGSPYEAEFVERRSNGRLEIRELQSDDYKKTVLERFVVLKDAPADSRLGWPQSLWPLERGDRVSWTPADGEVQEVKFHGYENGKVHIKAGKTKNRNEYVDLNEIVIIQAAEAV
jgi:hypothetical protein